MLFDLTLLFGVMGYNLLFRTSKVRIISFRMMDFFYSKSLSFFYEKRKAIMSKNWFLIYLRIIGIIVLLMVFLFLYLIIFKLRGN
jgi:hypothetical protein